MATPLEMNTTELEGLLQDVYNLPNRNSGGSSKPDLVIEYSWLDGPHGISANMEGFTFNSDDVVNVYNKLLAGNNVNCVLKAEYWPHSGGYVKANSPHMTAYAQAQPSNPDRIGYMAINFNLYKVSGSDVITLVDLYFDIKQDGSAILSNAYCRLAYAYSSTFV